MSYSSIKLLHTHTHTYIHIVGEGDEAQRGRRAFRKGGQRTPQADDDIGTKTALCGTTATLSGGSWLTPCRGAAAWASPSWALEYNAGLPATMEVTGQTVGPLGLSTGERGSEWGSFLTSPSSRSKEHFRHLHCQDHLFLASLLYSSADVTTGSPFSSSPHPWLHIRITGERGLYSMLGCHLQGATI